MVHVHAQYSYGSHPLGAQRATVEAMRILWMWLTDSNLPFASGARHVPWVR